MMKRYWPIALILAFIAYFVYALLLISPKLNGTAFTSIEKDTIPLNNVSVKLIIDQPDTKGIIYDKEYKTLSDSAGAYIIEINFVPYIAHYSLIFTKQGYDTLVFRKTLRRSSDFVFNANMIQSIKKSPKANIIGSFDSSIKYIDPEPHLIMFLIFAFAIIVFLAIRYNLYQRLKDKLAKMNRRTFSQIKVSDQKNILDRGVFCENCQTNNGMEFEYEETIQGMSFLYGKCPQCQEKLKTRWIR